MSDIVGTVVFEICAAVYLTLSIVAALAKVKAMKRRYFVAACLASALWALSATLPDTAPLPILSGLADILRTGSWICFLATLWGHLDDSRLPPPRRVLVTRACVPILIVIAIVTVPYFFNKPSTFRSFFILVSLVNVILPVIGLLLIENLLRTSGASGRWEIKHLCLALGTMMTFDFFIHSDVLVEGGIDDTFVAARGLIFLLVAPLIVNSFFRLKNWTHRPDVKLLASPKPAFYTVALVASGLYLLMMASLAYYLREIGGRWGFSFQITFLVAALLIMLVSLTSSQIKSHIKIIILKNFFTYRYDYREEWLHFNQIMSAQQPSSLGFRLVRAIADLLNCPAGALWILQSQDECFFVDAIWNLAAPHPPTHANSSLIQFFRRTCRIIDIDEFRAVPERYGDLTLPEWITDRPSVWLIVPLIHRNDVLGFLILDQARARHRLDWEDRDLLSTAAIQAASYLAEELTAEELRAARRLEDFNRQFAFVVHDIKNVVGQMSLMLENAKKFGDNPDFRKDMLETVDNAVGRMRALLGQLAAHRRQPSKPQAVELVGILGRVAQRWSKTATNLSHDFPSSPVYAEAVEATLESVLDLLIDNALAASGPTGAVLLRLRVDGDRISIEVSDNGPGMDQTFVNKELFRPLASTKSTGYGIGAYQTRHLVREMGAQLEVDTAPQRGTTMRIVMSKLAESAPIDHQTSAQETGQG